MTKAQIAGNKLIMAYLPKGYFKSWITPDQLHYHDDLMHQMDLIALIEANGYRTSLIYMPNCGYSFLISKGILGANEPHYHFNRIRTKAIFFEIVRFLKFNKLS